MSGLDHERPPPAAELKAGVDGAEPFASLKPALEAIARTLARPEPDDRTLEDEDLEAARARAAGLVRTLGVALGSALADAFAKWAERLPGAVVAGLARP